MFGFPHLLWIKLRKQRWGTWTRLQIALLMIALLLASCRMTPTGPQDRIITVNPIASPVLEQTTPLLPVSGTAAPSATSVTPFTLTQQDIPKFDNGSGLAKQASDTIAFISERREEGNLDVWLIDPRTTLTTEVTSDEAQDTQPRWSSDGRYLAFRSEWPDGHSTLRIYDAVTDDLNELDPGDNPYDIDWLPNQLRLIYANSDFQVRLLDLSGKKSDIVFEQGRAPAVSPDGDKVAFIASWPEVIGERLALFSMESKLVDSVIDDPLHPERGYTVGTFNWSPNGQKIVEARNGSRISIPFVVVYDTNLQPLATLPIGSFLSPGQPSYGSNLCSPTWLGDSGDVIFIFQPEDSDGFCVGRVYVADNNLHTIRQLVQGDDFASPAVSPDGDEIVVNRGYGDASGSPATPDQLTMESSVWVMNRDGSDLRLLTDGPGYDGGATWRPAQASQQNNQ